METVYGVENMEIWVIVIQIANYLLDICKIEDDICHICTFHWGYPYVESDFFQGVVSVSKNEKKKQADFV